MKFIFKSVLAVGVLASFNASAYDLPTVNLGATSFLDGAPPPAGEGFYFQQYLQQYSSDKFKDGNGNKLALPKQKIDATVSLSQLIYQSPNKIGDYRWGMSLIVPTIVSISTDDGLNQAALSNQAGLGDITLGGYLQLDPVMGESGPIYAQRFELTVLAPTGKYDPETTINPGSNFWAFNPYWAATLWVTPDWTVSWRAHYLWSAKNTDPSVSFGPSVSSTQAGQAYHVNFSTEYAVTPQLRLGLAGYYLNQFTDTKVDGEEVAGRRERVLGVGPGITYSFSKDNHIFLNTYIETNARNRTEGTRLQLRYTYHF